MQMSIEFGDSHVSLENALRTAANNIHAESITLGELLGLVGEHGLLLFSIVLASPLLLPVSIPGVSTIFAIVIILIGLGVTLNRVPWLPQFVLKRPLQRDRLIPVFEKAAGLFSRLDGWLRPRMPMMTDRPAVNRLNGLMMTLAGVLLLFPISILPFSNTIPAAAVLLLAAGMLQRDGLFILAGYVAVVISVVYFGIFGLLIVRGGQALVGV
ncbi:MAG: exopolysaccharide biosynthesis protein [Chloroflexi bacterium]|nr:exopolysaccharide biosynthesis protein [Chloroflexota bacterium]